MKTSELKGTALDWAVAKCEGYNEIALVNKYIRKRSPYISFITDLAHGGPIIEREKIEIFIKDEKWFAYSTYSTTHDFYGETPLIAAMRCYVASKLGSEVEVPEEVLHG